MSIRGNKEIIKTPGSLFPGHLAGDCLSGFGLFPSYLIKPGDFIRRGRMNRVIATIRAAIRNFVAVDFKDKVAIPMGTSTDHF